MTIASFLSRRRRVLLLCAASVLLHFVMIGWVGARIGLPSPAAPPAVRAPIVAQLRAPPAAAPLPQAAPPRPRAVRTRARPPLPPAPAVSAAALPVEMTTPQQEALLAESDAAALLPDLQPPAPAGLRVQMPPSSALSLDVARTDADGAVWSGAAAMSWKTDGAVYTMSVEAGISVIVTRLNLLTMTSEGKVGQHGFEPTLATEKRRGRAQTATHFNREQGSITFSASQVSVALAPGAQDKATLPLQLAAIARADPAQFDGALEILVGEERSAAVYRFMLVGEEDVDTKLGVLKTLHLTRPPRPGSYNSRLDVWLAPAHGWYPVRIRNTEASGAVTTQTVSKIVLTDTGS
jgi:hypothetical protein